MYERFFIEIKREMGRIKYSLSNFNIFNTIVFNNKIMFVIFAIMLFLLIPNFCSAYYVNNELADYQNINFDTIDNFINNCSYTDFVTFLNDNKDDYNMIIFQGGYYGDSFYVLCLDKYLTYHLISSSYFSNLREGYTNIEVTPSKHIALYTNSTRDSDFKYVSYKASNNSLSSFQSQTYHSYLNQFNDYNVEVELFNNIDLINNTIYTNYDLKLFDNDTLNTLISSSGGEEPIEEPIDDLSSDLLTLDDIGEKLDIIANIQYFYAFILTLLTLYTFIRNIFKR